MLQRIQELSKADGNLMPKSVRNELRILLKG